MVSFYDDLYNIGSSEPCGEEVIPDGSFEMVQTCPHCGGQLIRYYENKGNYSIQARCGGCGRYIKFVKRWNNRSDWSKEVKRRDQFTCQRCGVKGTSRSFAAHHKIPVWFMPQLEFDLNNGICLCKACHKAIHGKDGTVREDERINPNELCWSTGNYTDECDCEFCSHKHECSGYGGEEG